MVIDEMIWNFNGFHMIYWFHSFLFSSFWYLLLGFFCCKLIQIICSSLHSAATWSPFHISWSFLWGGLWFYLILQIHIIIGTVPIHDGKSVRLIGDLVPGSTTPMSRVAGLWACVAPTFAIQAARHMWAVCSCAMGCMGTGKSSPLWSFCIWFAKKYEDMQDHIDQTLISQIQSMSLFLTLSCSFWHFQSHLTPGYHGFVTAVCEEAGVIDDLLGQWPLNRFASQIVRVETTVSLGIVRLCCVVHRPSCRRCRVDWGLITFITSDLPRHQSRPQLVWKMSPSRTSALAHWCTTLVSSQGMLWWPRTDVWMNAKGTCFSSAKQGNPQTIPNTKHHSTRSLISWRCTVLAVDCVESLWVMILFLRSVLPILLLTNILRGSVAWSFGNTSRYRGRLLARCLPTSRWEINGSCQEVLQSWRWFFDHQDRCKITRSFWEELSKRQQVRRWKSCKHQHTSTIFKMRMLFGARPGVECNLLQGDLWGASCFGTCLTSGAWAQRHSRDSRGPKKDGAQGQRLERLFGFPELPQNNSKHLKDTYLCHLVSWLCWHVDARTWEFVSVSCLVEAVKEVHLYMSCLILCPRTHLVVGCLWHQTEAPGMVQGSLWKQINIPSCFFMLFQCFLT